MLLLHHRVGPNDRRRFVLKHLVELALLEQCVAIQSNPEDAFESFFIFSRDLELGILVAVASRRLLSDCPLLLLLLLF